MTEKPSLSERLIARHFHFGNIVSAAGLGWCLSAAMFAALNAHPSPWAIACDLVLAAVNVGVIAWDQHQRRSYAAFLDRLERHS